MQYSLGIDAGGTYTDAVILRDSDSRIGNTLRKPQRRRHFTDVLVSDLRFARHAGL